MPIESGLPILPGPFSFLQSAGEAAGAIGSAIEARRDKRRSQAQEKANNYLALRAAGLMSPEEFAKPEVQQVFNDAGFGVPSSTPTSGERVEGIRRRATMPDRPETTIPIGDLISGLSSSPITTPPIRIPATGPSSISDEERMIAGLPTRSAITGEKVAQGKGQQQLDVLNNGTLAQKRALANVPSPTTAQAAEDQATDTQFNSLALRAVDAAITQSGGRINARQLMALADNAWSIAQEDAKMRGYVADEQFTKPYIMAVITSRLREQRVADIQAQAATNRGVQAYQDYISLLRDQQRLAQQQLIGLVKPSNNEFTQAALYEQRLRQASTPAERQAVENNVLLKQSYDRVQTYQQASDRLNAEIAGYQAQLQGALSRVVVGISPTPPSGETGTLSERQVNMMVQRMDADPKYRNIATAEADIRAAVQSGEMSQADANRVLSRLQQRRGVTGAGTTPPADSGAAPTAAPAPRYRSGASIVRRATSLLGSWYNNVTPAQRQAEVDKIVASANPEQAIRALAADKDLDEDQFGDILDNVNIALRRAGKPRINPDMRGTQ